MVKGTPINMKDVYEKCARGLSPQKYSFGLFKTRVEGLKSRWTELNKLLNNENDYKFGEVSSSVLELFKGM